MNLTYLKYIIEVEKTGSITKASQNLYINQPHLSKILRDFKKELGFPVFNRTNRGVVPTSKGEQFLNCAKTIVSQIDEIELLQSPSPDKQLCFSISVPHATYIAHAFTLFLKECPMQPSINISYKETSLLETIRNITSKDCNLGVVRFQSVAEQYYRKMFKQEGLDFKELWEFPLSLLLSSKSPLANEAQLNYLDLKDFVEIVCGDYTTPSFTYDNSSSLFSSQTGTRKITVYERGSQFQLLCSIFSSYMWTSPIPKELLSDFQLIQKECCQPGNLYKDVLIYRTGHTFSNEDKSFISCLEQLISDLRA